MSADQNLRHCEPDEVKVTLSALTDGWGWAIEWPTGGRLIGASQDYQGAVTRVLLELRSAADSTVKGAEEYARG